MKLLSPRLTGYLPYILYPKQLAFLWLPQEEAMYGGAAGGGKSVALLAGALQYVDVPGYNALILRRTFAQLSKAGALMDLANTWLRQTAARPVEQGKKWIFPSGASLEFGHMEHEASKYNYAGAAYQYIAFDELTQFSESQYTFLFSRKRRATGATVPTRLRSASNPGGIGHDWVKARFLARRDPGRVFVPARLEDNPGLDYADYVASLGHLDPITREQLLRGDWDAYQGGRFRRDWFKYYRRHGSGWELACSVYTQKDIFYRFLTVDHATSTKELVSNEATNTADPDWTVISAWGMVDKPPHAGHLLWLGCTRVRLEFPDIPPLIVRDYRRHGCDLAIIEGGGPQKALVQTMRRERLRNGATLNVQEFLPAEFGDKLSRANSFVRLVSLGKVWLPAPGVEPDFPVEEVEGELLRYTGDPDLDAHDDIVDTGSMAALHVRDQQDCTAGPAIPYVMEVGR